MVQNGDFILIEYAGKDSSGNVFDSTHGDVGKKMHGKSGPLLIIFGKDMLVSGLQEALLGMKKGDKKNISLPCEKAFGRRSKNMIRTLSLKDFYRSEIAPSPGVVVNMDTPQGKLMGVVKSVNSGRVLVDFNHPLADQSVSYDLSLVDILEGTKIKVDALLSDLQIAGTATLTGDVLELSLSKKNENLTQKKAYLEMLIKTLFPSEIKTVNTKEVEG